MRSRKISWLISVLLSALFVLALALQITAPKRAIPLAPESIGHLRGNAYAFVIPKPYGWPILRTRGDTYDARYSKLVLLEDGKPLPYPHGAMPTIENLGRGRFLHLRETELYFSTSDNTDPRSNRRNYQALIAATPFPGLVDALFTATIVAWTFVLTSCGIGRSIRFRSWTIPVVIGFAAIALLWQVLILGPIPRIVMSADAGLVSSIVAANLHPAKFAADYVFSDPGNFAFYQTLLIPLVSYVDAAHQRRYLRQLFSLRSCYTEN